MNTQGSTLKKCFNGLKWNSMNKDLFVALTVQIREKKKSVSEINRNNQMYEKSRLTEFEGANLSNHFAVALYCLKKKKKETQLAIEYQPP